MGARREAVRLSGMARLSLVRLRSLPLAWPMHRPARQSLTRLHLTSAAALARLSLGPPVSVLRRTLSWNLTDSNVQSLAHVMQAWNVLLRYQDVM